MTGAMSVETVVIPTENATSPLHKKLMIFEDTPPGQQPTRTSPNVKPGERLKNVGNGDGNKRHNSVLRHRTDKNI